MEKSAEEILQYTPKEFYALDEKTRWEYGLKADELLRERYERELSGEKWIVYIDGHGVVQKSSGNKELRIFSDLLEGLERKYGKVAFLILSERHFDGWSKQQPKSKDPTLTERLNQNLADRLTNPL